MQNRSRTIALFVAPIALFCSLVFADNQSNERILVQDNSAFAMDLYQKLRASDGNIFFSPYSISTALAMTYGGARGNTEKEMANTLKFSLDQGNLHPAFAQLESRLNHIQKTSNIKLSVANSLWPQQGYEFRAEYLSLIKKNYGVTITPVDFMNAREVARSMINRWVENKTQNKIKNLISNPDMLDALTRLVLVNAIYFKGNWESQFKADKTTDSAFYVSSQNPVHAPIMTQQNKFKYADLESFQMLELPYVGNEMSMIVLLPKTIDGLTQFEDDLSTENLERWKTRLSKRDVVVFLPKFKMTSEFALNNTLASMGMVDAFSKLNANFSGMDGRPDWLYIKEAIHKAFIEVNEEGTEAAAATAVVMSGRSLPPQPIVFRADHPFVFLIQENQTGSILFMGRVIDPGKSQ